MLNKIGKFLGNISCGIGLHKYGDWQYQTNDACSQTRVCSRCQNAETRIWHSWDNWFYIADQSCEQSRICLRCSAKDHQIAQHQWGEWAYIRSDSCNQIRTCSRCKESESRTVSHTWEEWQYSTQNSCVQTRLCRRCGISEEKEPVSSEDHKEWGDWEYASPNSCQSFERFCLQCGAMDAAQTNSAIHDWDSWEQSSASMQSRVCKHCNQVETQLLPGVLDLPEPVSSVSANSHTGIQTIMEEQPIDPLYSVMEELPKAGTVPPAEHELKQLRIAGRITYANGMPLPNARVEIAGSGLMLNYEADSNGNGIYSRDVSPGMYTVTAKCFPIFNGRRWSFPLHPSDNSFTLVDPTLGATKDFSWQIRGLRTNGEPSNAFDYYGAFIFVTVEYQSYQLVDGFNSVELEFQLVPISKLIDGSTGQNLIIRRTGKEIKTPHGVNDERVVLNTRYLPDIPIGKYQLTVKRLGLFGELMPIAYSESRMDRKKNLDIQFEPTEEGRTGKFNGKADIRIFVG